MKRIHTSDQWIRSDSCYVNSCRTFLAVLNFELNVLTFSQSFEAITLDSGEVYEHVFAAISRSNEAKTFRLVEPLNLTFNLCHLKNSLDCFLRPQAGIAKEKLLLDPGFGFGKNLSHNYSLLARLAEFHHFNLPLLVGMSRKSMIGQLLNVGPSERLSGSLACAVIAAMQGAHIIRVHDVKETVEAMRVVEATLSAKENKRYE